MSDNVYFHKLLKKAFSTVSKDPEETLRLFSKLVHLSTPDEYRSQAHIGRGLVYAQVYEEYDLVIKENDAAIQFNSVQPSAFINRAQAFGYYEDNENAMKDYDEAIARAPHWVEPYLHRAFFAADMKNYKLAVESFTEVIQLDPNHAIAYFNRGYMYMNYMNEPMKALSDYNESIRLDPKSGDVRSYRGFLYFDVLKNLERAMEDFEESIKLKSANGYFWRSWIQAYVHKTNFQKALSDMEHSIKLDSFAVRHVWKAFIEMNLGRQEEALVSLSLGNVKETRSDYCFVKGLMLLKEEKWKEALECFEGVFINHEQRYRPLPNLIAEDTNKHIASLKKMIENLSHSS